MTHKQLVKKTVRSFKLFLKDEKTKVISTYHNGTKRRFISRLRACNRGEYAILVNYKGGYHNKSAWYDTKGETLLALNAFTERSLLEEFLI